MDSTADRRDPMSDTDAALRAPRCAGAAFSDFDALPNNVPKGCRWSPDGLCLLTAGEEDRTLHLFELPEALLAPRGDSASEGDGTASGAQSADSLGAEHGGLRNALRAREGGAIYDYAWYPHMDSTNPATCCFLSSSKDHPLHLWDAYTGACRASYVAYNHLDEVVAAHSLAFDPSGGRIFTGFERTIRVFDLARPGRQCEVRPTCATRRSRDGQRGIISCFAFAPDGSGLYAAGSYGGTIGLYADSDPRRVIMELGGEPTSGGVTGLAFSQDSLLLYTGARRDGALCCWDVRRNGVLLARFERACPTNQRIGFELLGSASEGLLSASQDGRVLAYATAQPEEPPTTLLTFSDATNAATMHPWLPLLAVAAGERHFTLPTGDGSPLIKRKAGATHDHGAELAVLEENGTHNELDGDSARWQNGLSVWVMPWQQQST